MNQNFKKKSHIVTTIFKWHEHNTYNDSSTSIKNSVIYNAMYATYHCLMTNLSCNLKKFL